MRLTGTPDQIMAQLARHAPEVSRILANAQAAIREGKMKQAVYPYQAAALYVLARRYDDPKCRILEIGTYYGYSAAVLAQAAPKAFIYTVNPVSWEWEAARENLRSFQNVFAICERSWDYLAVSPGPDYDLVFVDGDHKRVRQDLPWWDRLTVGGLFLFHDYTPLGAPRHCPPVFEAVNEFAGWLGREPDVWVIDDQRVGMAGFYKKVGDPTWKGE